MSRRRGGDINVEAVLQEQHRPSTFRKTITPPVGDVEGAYRYSEIVRCGKLSHEVFSRERLAAIPLDLDVQEERDAKAKTTTPKSSEQAAAEIRMGRSGSARSRVKARGARSKQEG